MTKLKLFCGLALAMVSVCAQAGHTSNGEETNVIMMLCSPDYSNPPTIRVSAFSANQTPNFIPTVTRNEPCAQALHEFLSAGFKIDRDIRTTSVYIANGKQLNVVFGYVLTRQDNVIGAGHPNLPEKSEEPAKK